MTRPSLSAAVVERDREVSGVFGGSFGGFVQIRQGCHFRTNRAHFGFRTANSLGNLLLSAACEPHRKRLVLRGSFTGFGQLSDFGKTIRLRADCERCSLATQSRTR